MVVAIGDYVLNLGAEAEHLRHIFDNGELNGEASVLRSVEPERLFVSGGLNAYLRKGRRVWIQLHEKVTDLLRKDPGMYKELKELYAQYQSP